MARRRHQRSTTKAGSPSPPQTGTGDDGTVLHFRYLLFVRLVPTFIALVPLALLASPLVVESAQSPSPGGVAALLVFAAFVGFSTPTRVSLAKDELQVRYPLGFVRRLPREGSRFWLRTGRRGTTLYGAPLEATGVRAYVEPVEVGLRYPSDHERLVDVLGASTPSDPTREGPFL